MKFLGRAGIGHACPRPFARLFAVVLIGEAGLEAMPHCDYRGLPLLGVSGWRSQFGFGVATQINAAEVDHPPWVLQAAAPSSRLPRGPLGRRVEHVI
jgi:hypothetical protein